MADFEYSIGIDYTELIEALDSVKAALKDTAKQAEATANDIKKTSQSAGSDYADSLKTVTKATTNVAAETGILKTQHDKAAKSITGTEGAVTDLANAIVQKLGQANPTLQDSNNLFQRQGILAKAAAAGQKIWAAAVGETTGAMRVLRTAIAATGVGLLIVAIGELVAHWKEVTQWLGFTSDAQEALNDMMKKGADGAAKTVAHLANLSEQLKGSTLSGRELYNIQKELSKQYPNLINGQDLTKLSAQQLADVIDKQLIPAMKRKALLTAGEQELTAAYKKNLETQLGTAQDVAKWYQKLFAGAAGWTTAAVTLSYQRGLQVQNKALDKYADGVRKKASQTLADVQDSIFKVMAKIRQEQDMNGGDPTQGTSLAEAQRAADAARIEAMKDGINKEIALENYRFKQEQKALNDEILANRQNSEQRKLLEQQRENDVKAHTNNLLAIHSKYAAKAKADRAKEATDILKLQQEVNRQTIDLMQDGYEKQVMQEQLRHTQTVVSIGNRLLTVKSGSEQEKLLYEQSENETKQHNANLQKIDRDYFDSRVTLELQLQKMLAQANDDQRKQDLIQNEISYRSNINNLKKLYSGDELQQALTAATTIFARKQRETNAKFDLQTLESQRQTAERAAQQAVTGEEKKQQAILEVRKKYYELELQALKQAGLTENDQQVKNIQKLIDGTQDALNKGASKLQASAKINSFGDLLENLLKIPDEQQEKFESSLKEVSTAIQQTLTGALQQVSDAKQKQIDVLRSQIDDVQHELDRETQLQVAGYANNVEAKKKELDQLQHQREKDIKQQQAIQKIQQAIAAAKTAAQLSVATANMIAAYSAIFAKNAANPFGGIAIAIAETLAVAASFAALIAQVKALTSNAATPKFEHGGALELTGSTHAQGGIDIIDRKRGVTLGNAQGGELAYFFKDGKDAAKYMPLLDAINKQQLSSWDYSDMMRYINPRQQAALSINMDALQSMINKSKRADGINIVNTTDLRKVESKLSSIDERLKKANIQSQDNVVYLPDGEIRKAGVIKRHIKK